MFCGNERLLSSLRSCGMALLSVAPCSQGHVTNSLSFHRFPAHGASLRSSGPPTWLVSPRNKKVLWGTSTGENKGESPSPNSVDRSAPGRSLNEISVSGDPRRPLMLCPFSVSGSLSLLSSPQDMYSLIFAKLAPSCHPGLPLTSPPQRGSL